METDETLFDRQFAVNLKAPFFLTQAFAKTFGKGCVINMLDTDIAQMQGSHFAYLLSKKALAEFTAMAARVLGPKIRVNGICPGALLQNAEDKQFIEKLRPRLPLRRQAELEEVAQAVYFLCQDGPITGQLIFADGGQHLL